MTHRLGLLLAALLIALLGTSAVFSYVNRVEANTLAGAQPVDVLVAIERIASGTSAASAVQRKLVELRSMPRKSVPEGALASVDGVSEQTLISDVFAGEVLLKAKFATQTARTGELVIPKDRIAIAVELGDPQRVAGFVVPGSEVAIFATVEKMSGTASTTAVQTGNTAKVDVEAQKDDDYTRLLLPRVAVIAVGPATLRVAGEEKKKDAEVIATAVLTVAVNQDEAERLVHSAQTGDLYFGLLTSTSRTGAGKGVSNSTLFK